MRAAPRGCVWYRVAERASSRAACLFAEIVPEPVFGERWCDRGAAAGAGRRARVRWAAIATGAARWNGGGTSVLNSLLG